MSELIIKNKYPNIIVFTHNDMDGMFSAMLIKDKYDNNLANSAWDRNVHCYVCSYGEKYKSLDYFKEKVNEVYVDGMQNIVYMTDYAIQPNNLMLQFWNWLTDKGCEFYWLDHHITAIQNLKHLNIPGIQYSKNSGCLNTYKFLYENDENIPMCIRFANDFDIWNKSSEYSWDKQLHPLCYFINSLGIELNDNER
jgi:oligoribonuclease NrnB/cAMP/cGMP phosphodiesterase (DHH superfamily)